MSKEVNRNTVIKTITVRTFLKKDSCWIKTVDQEEAQPRTVPRHSYVRKTAKNYEPQAPTENIQKDTQSEETFADTAADVCAEVHVAEQIQNGEPQQIPSTEKNPKAVSPVEPAERSVANTTTENKGEESNKTVDKSNLEHSETKVSADAHVEDPKVETCVAPGVKPKPKEEPATKTEQDTATQLEHAGVQPTVQRAEGNREKVPPEQAAAEVVNAEAEVSVAPPPEISDVVDATLVKEVILQETAEDVAEIGTKSSSNTSNVLEDTPGNKAALQISVESVPDLSVGPESEGPSQRATETAPKGNREKVPPEQAAAEVVNAEAEVSVAPPPEISDVVDATLVKEVILQETAEDVADIVTKSSSNTSNVLEDPPGNKAAMEISVEPVPDLSAGPESEGPSQEATETAPKGNREKGPPEQAAENSIEAAADVAVESPSESHPVTQAAGENAPLPGDVDLVPDLVVDTACESLPTTAAETAVKHEASRVKAADADKPVLKTVAEEVVEHEVQPVYNPFIKQSVEPTTERAADHVIKDAFELVTSSDAESVEDKFSCRLIELSEADEEPPTTEVAPEPLKDPKQSHTEETKLNQHSDDTNKISDVCSFCEKIIDGNVKFYFSDPVWTCHPECLKCCVCTKDLGDLLSSIFSHDQGFQCGTCFKETL